MKSKQVLREVQEAIGVSSNKMVKIFNINRASFYRYISGVNEMGFDLISRILDKAKVKYDNNQLVPICPECIRLIGAMNGKDKKAVMLFFRDILEFGNVRKFGSKNIPDAELIVDENYRGFYRVLINYLLGNPIDKSIALQHRWSPLVKLYPSQEDRLDSFFLSHNIILPSGELKWK